VTFSRKYILWLLLPPAIVTGPLSFIFLTQVVRMSPTAALEVFGLFALFFLLGAVALSAGALLGLTGLRTARRA